MTITSRFSALAISGVFACIAIFSNPSIAFAKNIDDGLKAALNGPEIKKVTIIGSKFNVKPVTILKYGKSTEVVIGQLSHHVRWDTDDQIHYVMLKYKGRVVRDYVRINGGHGVLGKLPKFLNEIPWVNVTPDQLRKVRAKIENEGNWADAAVYFVKLVGRKAGNYQP